MGLSCSKSRILLSVPQALFFTEDFFLFGKAALKLPPEFDLYIEEFVRDILQDVSLFITYCYRSI